MRINPIYAGQVALASFLAAETLGPHGRGDSLIECLGWLPFMSRVRASRWHGHVREPSSLSLKDIEWGQRAKRWPAAY